MTAATGDAHQETPATHFVGSASLDGALAQEYRQYLVGALSEPQLIDHLQHRGLEVGISLYTGFSTDTPHSHDDSVECLIVLEGEYVIRELATGRERVLSPGDFLAIPARTPYASKTSGARVLFVKAPGGQDKRAAPVDAELRAWLEHAPPAPQQSRSSASLTDTIAVYGHHLAEWQHRDEQWLTISFRWFTAALLVSLLPHLENYFSLDTGLPPYLFTAAGTGLAVYFLMISTAYGARLSSSGATLAKTEELLPVELRRERLPAGGPRWTRWRMAAWTPWAMTGFLAVVNIASLVSLLAR